jgi:hypothetical protein
MTKTYERAIPTDKLVYNRQEGLRLFLFSQLPIQVRHLKNGKQEVEDQKIQGYRPCLFPVEEENDNQEAQIHQKFKACDCHVLVYK